MKLSAKTVILEALSRPEVGLGMPVRVLLRHAQVFDIGESTVRVALARLRGEGLVDAPSRGVYRLGPRAAPIQDQVRGWRDVEAQLKPWDGGWIGAHVAGLPRSDRAALRACDRAFRMTGFRQLAPGLMVRPDNLVEGVDGVRGRLRELGVDASAPVFALRDLSVEDDRAARGLWDGAALAAGYDEIRQQLADSEARFDAVPLDQAIREAFVLGREAIRALVLSPRLPEPLIRQAARAGLGAAMRRYDERAKALWIRYLDGDGDRAAAGAVHP